MTKRTMNPNSLKNLDNRVYLNSGTATKAQQKGAATRRKRGIVRKTVIGLLEDGTIRFEDIAQTIINEALQGKEWAIKLIYDMDENYQNRKLKSHSKESNKKNDIMEFFKNIKVGNIAKQGEVPPYESLGRTID
ncbi:MAG: hypothetical protein IPO85_13980 [Saprospiraceae bacterium]|uniref:Uncharacterized protein n=1 Tax=Candidatus Defluviibacterium haderslevense TaxID=2981993 RepID=A0A9D7SAV2_9BACT|nr:hypothetical protein [Candidatus Defluviibacterium haderslevense]